ncbi:predicted protein [Chaetoceros tenuissimus]|uniref:Uncharacterized protein n=1 Tax=Chaetoceros tenuissimus TaxID=426638 RepID=A0AAD3CQE4_9STRA|nr:predicted protein [Chaetoceros tenuissimus]
MSLDTGKRIRGHQWDELAITDEVIERVHELAAREKADFLDENGIPKLGMSPGNNMTINDTDIDEGDSDDGSTYVYDDVTVSSTSSEGDLDSSDDSSFHTSDVNESDDKLLPDNPGANDLEEEVRSVDISDELEEPRSEEFEVRSEDVEVRSKDDADVEDNSIESNDEDTGSEYKGEDNNEDTNSNTTEERPQRSQRARRPPQDPLSNIGSTGGKSYMQKEEFNQLLEPSRRSQSHHYQTVVLKSSRLHV